MQPSLLSPFWLKILGHSLSRAMSVALYLPQELEVSPGTCLAVAKAGVRFGVDWGAIKFGVVAILLLIGALVACCWCRSRRGVPGLQQFTLVLPCGAPVTLQRWTPRARS